MLYFCKVISIEFDIIQSVGIGIIALLLDLWLTRKIAWLQRYCIPAPVSGGMVISLLFLALYCTVGVEAHFDGTMGWLILCHFALRFGSMLLHLVPTEVTG